MTALILKLAAGDALVLGGTIFTVRWRVEIDVTGDRADFSVIHRRAEGDRVKVFRAEDK